eukprot:scaffold108817_cov18-Tisochrysis_lutea.AAC.1
MTFEDGPYWEGPQLTMFTCFDQAERLFTGAPFYRTAILKGPLEPEGRSPLLFHPPSRCFSFLLCLAGLRYTEDDLIYVHAVMYSVQIGHASLLLRFAGIVVDIRNSGGGS